MSDTPRMMKTPSMVPTMPRARRPEGGRTPEMDVIARRIHNVLLNDPDLSALYKQGHNAILERLHDLVMEAPEPLSSGERESLTQRLLDDVTGLGPLQPLLEDPNISDILVNTFERISIDVNGKHQQTDITFNSDAHLRAVIDRIVSGVGRRIDESSPMVDARLQDGSRVNAVLPPLSIDGPQLSIRRFPENVMTPSDLVDRRTLSDPMMQVLEAAVRCRLNIVVAGGTGAGKTTLLNCLSLFLSPWERIITIEDSAELRLNGWGVVRLETRPPSIEGKGAVRQRELLINALRMRPDRIILGEVRGAEAIDVLQAMNTGHEGSLTTIHANSPRDALSRLETMCMETRTNLSEIGIRRQIASAVHLVVQAARFSDGSRRITHISEITGMAGDVVSMQDLFLFERRGIDSHRRIKGVFRGNKIIPHFHDKLQESGLSLPESIYESEMEV